jgi:hypothetical protein
MRELADAERIRSFMLSNKATDHTDKEGGRPESLTRHRRRSRIGALPQSLLKYSVLSASAKSTRHAMTAAWINGPIDAR